MKIKYVKHRTRARSIIRQQICDLAERIELPKLCANLFYFKPLFVYEKEKGVNIYYDFSSIDQDPTFGAMYFQKNQNHYKGVQNLRFFDFFQNRLRFFVELGAFDDIAAALGFHGLFHEGFVLLAEFLFWIFAE